MTNLGSDNCIAPVGADRFVQSRFCGRSIILALKWTNAKIVLQFAKMFPPRFVTSRISGECLWFAANLRGDEGEHVWRRTSSHQERDLEISNKQDALRTPIGLRLGVVANQRHVVAENV